MGSIVSTGVGSGLDVTGLVQKLVEAEGAPKAARLDTAEAKAQAKLSALGSLRSALAGFRDTVAKLKNIDAFQGRQVTLSKDEFVSATATTTAALTSYSIEVDHLAAAHKLQSDSVSRGDDAGGNRHARDHERRRHGKPRHRRHQQHRCRASRARSTRPRRTSV